MPSHAKREADNITVASLAARQKVTLPTFATIISSLPSDTYSLEATNKSQTFSPAAHQSHFLNFLVL